MLKIRLKQYREVKVRKREEYKGLRGLANVLYPQNKALVTTSLLYTHINYYNEPPLNRQNSE